MGSLYEKLGTHTPPFVNTKLLLQQRLVAQLDDIFIVDPVVISQLVYDTLWKPPRDRDGIHARFVVAFPRKAKLDGLQKENRANVPMRCHRATQLASGTMLEIRPENWFEVHRLI